MKDNTILYITDDVFSVNRNRAKKIMRMMIEEKLNMPWKAELRTDHLDPELCQLMKESGCVRAKIRIRKWFSQNIGRN